MTWARNIFVVVTAFLLGRSQMRLGWHEFMVQQGAIVLVAAVLIGGWFLIALVERRVKGKPNAAVTVTALGGSTASVPVRFCPKCGVRLARGAFAHVEACHGGAAA